MKVNRFLGLDLVNGRREEVLKEVEVFLDSGRMEQKVLLTPNPEMFVEASRNPDFANVLKIADWLLPDGFGILMWARLFFGVKFEQRLTGVDFVQDLLNLKKYKVFIVGGKFGAAKMVGEKYVEIVGFYDEAVSLEKNEELLVQIRDSQAEVVLVALGAPKQEFWINKFRDELSSVKLFLGIGGAVDFMAGQQKRAPEMFQKLGLEWLYRLYKEPARLKRIYNAVIVFSCLCIKSRFGS